MVIQIGLAHVQQRVQRYEDKLLLKLASMEVMRKGG